MLNKTSNLALGAVIAAAYAALTLAVAPIAYGAVQFRISEAMCVLPFLIPRTGIGLTVGCLLANAIGLAFGITFPMDVVIGPIATAIAAFCTARCRTRWLAPLPPVVSNGILIGGAIALSTAGAEALVPSFLYNALTVAAGEAVVCFGLGIPLLLLFEKNARLRAFVEKYR